MRRPKVEGGQTLAETYPVTIRGTAAKRRAQQVAKNGGSTGEALIVTHAKAAAALAKGQKKAKQPKRTPEEQRAEIERVAHEHGADLSEEGFNEALRAISNKRS